MKLPSCWCGRWEDPGGSLWCATRAFSTGQRAGARLERSWPRWSITPGSCFPRDNFIVTNLTLPSRSVVRFYNQRGTAEQWIKEGQQATHGTRLSCHRFRANEVRLQWSVLAYNLGNLWRRLGLPPRIKSWSLTSLQQRLMKTGGRLVQHARYDWLLPAEGPPQPPGCSAICWGDIWALPLPSG